MLKPKNLTLPQMLTRAVLRSVIAVFFVFAGYSVMGAQPVQMVTPETPSVERPAAKGSPVEVLSRMGDDCWTGNPPSDMEGVIPGHVVYAKGTTGAKIGGTKMVGQALGQLFENETNNLTIYAFCR